jgi:mRNA interferase RelE/StbE
MIHELIYSAKAREDLKRLDIQIARRIISKLRYYSYTPDPLSYAKPLKNRLFGEYRFRIGDYRVLFDCDSKGKMKILTILKIAHRKQIYL